MNFLRKFFKALWVAIVKPMVLAPINLCTGATKGDSPAAVNNRNGVINLITLVAVVGVMVYAGGLVGWGRWVCIGYGAAMGQVIANLIPIVKESSDNDYDEFIAAMQA